MARICIIQGHPHATGNHFCHALAKAYRDGAREALHEVQEIDIATLTFDLLRDPAEMALTPAGDIHTAQLKIKMADHLLISHDCLHMQGFTSRFWRS